jgi:protein involved in polysaccharide export with SLBB domain
VIVPRYDQTRNAIGIYGEVNAPGRFEYVEGDGARALLEMGFGFTPAALADSVELSRLSDDGEHMTSQFFNGTKLLAGAIPDIPLQPGDRIVVRGRTERRSDFRVTLVGEFVHPGIYPITKNRTRLTDVVAMAGGFTVDAAIASAEVSRRSVEQAGIEMERLESLRGGVTAEDSAYYYLETELRLKKEIVNIDFEGLFARGDTTHNIVLRDNDYIVVPSGKKSVYVYGQVVTPGHIPFVPGQGPDYYLRKAGGLTERARGDDIKIVKAKSKQWLSPRETSIEDGDYVWVPKDPERPFGYWIAVIGQTAAVLSVAISLVLLVLQLNN